ncbi:MAG: BlaI/MecI/CopY family transcriptional regulator [Thermoleophilaceae bacterium]
MTLEGQPPPLHELEAEVMEHVWDHDRATVREVLEALNRGPRQRAYTTVMTIMGRLHRKGVLEREREGRTDVYWPALGRAAYLDARAKAEVEALVEEFGDVALAHFAGQVERLDPERLEKLRRLAGRD